VDWSDEAINSSRQRGSVTAPFQRSLRDFNWVHAPADQTRLYSQKGWDDLRFSEAAVRRDAVSRVVLRGR
jgi:hypothetical protein